MYHVFFDANYQQYIQVRDTDLKTNEWSKKLLPWYENAVTHWGSHPFRDHGYLRIASSETPFDPDNHPEFFI